MTREKSLELLLKGRVALPEETDTEVVKTGRGLKGLNRPSGELSDPGLYRVGAGASGQRCGQPGPGLGKPSVCSGMY